MDEREVVCSRCENYTTIVRDSVQSGWIFQEPSWALINHAYYCPRCNYKLVRNNREINKKMAMYPTIKIKEDEG